MKKYPYIHQENSNDCGIACLQMVIRYYKGFVPKSILSKFTYTDKLGTTAYHMIETLKQLGFEAKGVSYDFSKPESVILPCIAHVTIQKNYLHYIVIYEIDWKKKVVVIADPASQLQKMNFEAFLQIYNKVLIILHPIQKIPVYHNSFSFVTYTLKIIKQYWKSFLIICMASLFVFLLSLLSTFYIQILFHTSFHYIPYLLLLFILFEATKHIFSYFRNIWIGRFHQKLSLILSKDAFSKIMQLPYLEYHNLPTGDFMARIQDIYLIQETITSVAFTILFDCLLFLCAFIFILYLEPILFVICIIVSISYWGVMHHYKSIHQKNIFALEQQNVRVQTYLNDYMHGFEMVKGLSLTEQVIHSYAQKYRTYTEHFYQFQKQVQKEALFRNCFESLGYIAFLAVGIFLYEKGQLNVGMFFTYQLLFSFVMSPIVQIVDSNFLIERAKNAMERISNLSSSAKIRTGKNDVIQEIVCHGLCYHYKEVPILKDLNMTWRKGQKILCMGTSGSGKSTLLKCIKGYYPIKGEQLLINKKSYINYDSTYLNNQILYISQNESLIVGSLWDNLTLMNTYSKKRIEDVIALCEIDTIVKENPLQYQMLIEENGNNLSGGQRAQIVLARTLLRSFQVLLIDEGFGQMDSNLERRILKQIFSKYPDKIIVVVSHRKENMDLYDLVVQMEKGKVVDCIERSVS